MIVQHNYIIFEEYVFHMSMNVSSDLLKKIYMHTLALYYMIVFVFLGKPRTADRVVSCMDFTTLPHGLNHILTKAFNVFVGC